jgi:hypothetical protein
MKHTDGNKGQVPAKKQVNPNLKPGPGSNSPAEVKAIKQEAEQNEVAGRHKNDGQMGHKGAR